MIMVEAMNVDYEILENFTLVAFRFFCNSSELVADFPPQTVETVQSTIKLYIVA